MPGGLPHLNIIVVLNNKEKMPPNDVIERSGMRPDETHRAAFERLKAEVFGYGHWDELLFELGLADG